MLIYLVISLLLAVAPLVVRTERASNIIATLFFLVQVASIVAIFVLKLQDSVMLSVFRVDTMAVLFHILMVAVLGFTLIHSSSYLHASYAPCCGNHLCLLL